MPAWDVAAQLGHKQNGLSTTEIYAPCDRACLSNSVAAIVTKLAELIDAPQLMFDAAADLSFNLPMT